VAAKGLIWVGLCAGADRQFVSRITPYMHERNVFGFYLMDDPDPRIGLAQCKPDSLRAEADWIHDHVPGALTFIVVMNLSTAGTPSFQHTYNPTKLTCRFIWDRSVSVPFRTQRMLQYDD